jgi:hypothetical protein
VTLAMGAHAAHTESVQPRLRKHADILLNVGGMMIKASPSAPSQAHILENYPV